MALSNLRTWLKDLPLPVRRMYGYGRRILRPDPIWNDPEFKRCYEWLLQTQWWSRPQLQELQLKRLRDLLTHAYENVPYYRRLFQGQGITPKDIATLQDLQKLPFTTRKDVQQNRGDLLARNMDLDKLRSLTTGGTTGIPLVTYHEDTSEAHEEAFLSRQWTWAGYRFGDRLLILRDYFIGRRDSRGRLVKWDYDTTRNALVLSTFYLSEQIMPSFIALIREFRPQFIHAFPSAVALLARYMYRHGIDDIRPSAIFCESETVYPWQRELIESQFGCKIFAGYGDTEMAVSAWECECHQGYHWAMEYGILEIVDETGRPVTEEGQAGIVVGTGFYTYAMPMIRYRTDDIARYTQRQCRCGRELPLITDIEGRLHEVFVTSDDELIPVGILRIGSPGYNNVEQFQFLQEKKGELVLKIVMAPSFSKADAHLILDELSTQFHGKMQVQLVFVDNIPRTSRLKHQILDQRLRVTFSESRWAT